MKNVEKSLNRGKIFMSLFYPALIIIILIFSFIISLAFSFSFAAIYSDNFGLFGTFSWQESITQAFE